MDSQRNFLIISFLFLSFIIWQTWQSENYLQEKKTNNQYQNFFIKNNTDDDNKYKNVNNKITVNTDVLSVVINNYGGDIEEAKLLKYPETLNSNQPIKLLQNNSNFIYKVQTGITGYNGPDNPIFKNRPIFKTDKTEYSMTTNQDEIKIFLNYTDKNKISFIKTFIFKRGEYNILINYSIKNNSLNPIELNMFGQIKQTINASENSVIHNNNSFAINAFRGAAYSTDKLKYKKYKFDSIVKKNLNIFTNQGWIAMLQQYFVTALIPQNKGNLFYTLALDNNKTAVIGYKTSNFKIDPGNNSNISSILWVGPEIQNKMAVIAPYLDLTVDYGMLWFIAQPLFKLLKIIHQYVNNWGYSIIIITFIIRLFMFPLTKAQYSSAAKMKMLQPKIKIINEKFTNDKHKLSQEILSLYKQEKVNPLGGCLPLIIQMPIFLALYYMLISSVELRHANFIFWIHDLTDQDPYYVLPIIMGLTMLIIQKISPNNLTTDPLQNKLIQLMPIFFVLFFLWCPSGLVLYYIVSNVVTIIQQKIIYLNLTKKSL